MAVDDIAFFSRGDANSDGAVDISDSVSILGFLFLGGPAPRCLDAADADDDGQVEITDAVVILNHLFLGVGSLAPPWPKPGRDPTGDGLPSCRR